MACVRMLVTGRVQGVGFRYYVSRQAERLGISGEVWNRRDGAVELLASHVEESRLAALEQSLYIGPGNVATVVSSPVEPGAFDGFSIGPTR